MECWKPREEKLRREEWLDISTATKGLGDDLFTDFGTELVLSKFKRANSVELDARLRGVEEGMHMK